MILRQVLVKKMRECFGPLDENSKLRPCFLYRAAHSVLNCDYTNAVSDDKNNLIDGTLMQRQYCVGLCERIRQTVSRQKYRRMKYCYGLCALYLLQLSIVFKINC